MKGCPPWPFLEGERGDGQGSWQGRVARVEAGEESEATRLERESPPDKRAERRGELERRDEEGWIG